MPEKGLILLSAPKIPQKRRSLFQHPYDAARQAISTIPASSTHIRNHPPFTSPAVYIRSCTVTGRSTMQPSTSAHSCPFMPIHAQTPLFSHPRALTRRLGAGRASQRGFSRLRTFSVPATSVLLDLAAVRSSSLCLLVHHLLCTHLLSA